MDACPVRLDLPTVTLLRAGIGKQPGLERGIGHFLGQRPAQAAAWKRWIVARTVDAATPIRRAISRIGTPPTNFNRRTSRTWRMIVLSAGIRSLLWNSQRSGPESASRGTRHPGRDHPGMVGGIISERWARSSRNGGRHHPGIAGGFLPESAMLGEEIEQKLSARGLNRRFTPTSRPR